MPQRIGVVVEPSHINDVGPGKYIAVFNPAVHLHEEQKEIYLFCRLVNIQGRSEIRRIILDLNYQIQSIDPESILVGVGEDEQLGCEDPRMVEIETHFLTYTAVRKIKTKGHWATRIGIAISPNLKDFQRLGLFLPEQDNNKDGVFLPGKINNSYWIFHRFHPNVWIASSDDLINWQEIRPVMFVRPGWWDSDRIGIGIVLSTDEGWLAFYHGADTTNVYRMGAALFDREKPWKLLARSRSPLLEPAKKYEKEGVVSNVVFPCGAIARNGTFVVFYGGADRVTAACEITKKEVFCNLRPIY